MDEENIELSNNMTESSATFPVKLFAMLLFDSGHTVDWLSHGLAFRVRDTNQFIQEIMPRYFKQTKLTSFQRQLNLYGFRRLTKGDEQGAYFHPKFQRGHRDMLSEIRRLPGKGTVPAVDYSGFQDFISNRISSTSDAAPQTSYNLRPMEHERSSLAEYSKEADIEDDHNIYAKSYVRSTRQSRNPYKSLPHDHRHSYPSDITSNYDNGNDVYNVRNTRKRPADDSYRPPMPPPFPRPIPVAPFNVASTNDMYNFDNQGAELKDSSLTTMYPRSKSKLTMNIGFEKIAGSGYIASMNPRRQDSFIQTHSSGSGSTTTALLSSSTSTTATMNPLPNPSITAITSHTDESSFSLSQMSELCNLAVNDASFEEYNRRQFDQAIKVVDLDQFDFDSLFPAQLDSQAY